jgi:hypothetical protein
MDTQTKDAPHYDRTCDDMSNIVALEHLNVQIADQAAATLFYVKGLQLTRDPFIMVELDNMWINAGRTQFHLPTAPSHPQTMRGTIGLVVPDLALIEASLARVAPRLAGTRFAFRRAGDALDATCPWGNRLRLHAPDPERWGQTELGIAYLDFAVPEKAARAIAQFYPALLGAPASVEQGADGLEVAHVRVGADQRLRFVETRGAVPAFDGHHIAIYIADFGGPHAKLQERGLVSRESDAHEWRFIDIVDPESGRVVYQLEHEVRSMRHPLFARPLVNRNPAQTNRHYAKGHDAFRGTY